MIVALAGRRIDPPSEAHARFPLDRVDRVRERIRTALEAGGAGVLVCAAACGADLIALAVAEELGMRRCITLPFGDAEFRTSSVTDRPGDWGPLYDRLIGAARTSGDLEILSGPPSAQGVYADANAAIIDRALALAREMTQPIGAIAVWDGPIAGRTDHTKDFVEVAQRHGIVVRTIGII